MKPFLKGTIMLACVILLSKLFGFIYRMQFMRIAGPEVVGIYMTTYPAFIFFISLAQIGLPLAVTKLVSTNFAAGNVQKTQLVLKKAISINIIVLIICLPIFILMAPIVAEQLLHNEAAVYPLFVSLFAIPFVIFSGLIKAYLQGIEKINITAWTLFFEQVIRIGLISFLFPLILADDYAIAAAQAMGITALTELCAALFVWPFYRREKRKLEKHAYTKSVHPTQTQAQKEKEIETETQFATSIVSTSQLFHIAIPTAGGKLFGTFTWFLEPIIFLKALLSAGLTVTMATSLYGVLSGVHIPLLLFPAFIPAALSIVLVPAISSAVAKKQFVTINQWISLAIRLSSLIGCYAAVLFFLYGDELAIKMFHIDSKENFMQLLAPIFFFYYVQSPLMSILQALDGAKVAMWNSIYGGIGKLACMFILASIPAFAMKGAIIAIGFGVLLTTFLHLFSIKAIPNVKIPFRYMCIPYICFIITVFLPLPLGSTIFVQIGQSFLLITFLLLITKQLKWSDFQLIFRLVLKIK